MIKQPMTPKTTTIAPMTTTSVNVSTTTTTTTTTTTQQLQTEEAHTVTDKLSLAVAADGLESSTHGPT